MLEWLEAQLSHDEQAHSEQLEKALAAAEQGDVAMLEWLEMQLLVSSSAIPSLKCSEKRDSKSRQSYPYDIVRLELRCDESAGEVRILIWPHHVPPECDLRLQWHGIAHIQQSDMNVAWQQDEPQPPTVRASDRMKNASPSAQNRWETVQSLVREWAAREVDSALLDEAQGEDPFASKLAGFLGPSGDELAATYIQAIWRGRQEREELWYDHMLPNVPTLC